jgi:FkbM family methyltransferase
MNKLPNTIITAVKDCRFIIFDKPDIVSNNLRGGGGHEAHLEDISKTLIGNAQDGTVLDIGANLGSYVVPVAKHFPNLKFFSFEPQRIIYYQLCSNIILNSLNNVTAIQMGISDEQKVIQTVVPNYAEETNIGAFSLDDEVRQNQYECATIGETEIMSIVTLDMMAIKNIRLIKIDVEGLELNVLKGGLKTLEANNYPPIIFEAWTYKPWFQERRKELYDYIESLGYKITIVGENNIAQHTNKPIIDFEVVNNV